jgi:hypothetical protein
MSSVCVVSVRFPIYRDNSCLWDIHALILLVTSCHVSYLVVLNDIKFERNFHAERKKKDI